MAPSGIEPATYRLVAQCLNQPRLKDNQAIIKYNLNVIFDSYLINTLNPELNPIRYLLALLGAHHFLHVSRIKVKLLTLGY